MSMPLQDEPTEKLAPGLEDLERPLTDKERRRWLLGPAIASPFDSTDRLFPSFETSGVFDRGQEDARDLKQMLRRDGRARSLENVLTLPIRSARPEVKEAGSGAKQRKAADMVRDNIGPWLRQIVAQATSAQVFRKAFFELQWEPGGDGVRIESCEYRPPATCQARFDPRTGRPAGFRQQVVTPGGMLLVSSDDEYPGWKIVPQPRSVIVTHGTHREPITGTSELDVTYWCWETRQKVLFLLFQFLETQSLPKLVAYGPDAKTAQANADYLAQAKASGVLPFIKNSTGAAGERFWDVLESSGQGAGQFLEAVRYLEEQQIQSVLAGFLQLTGEGKQGGSFALSHDSREFFLQSRQAAADEIAHQLTEQLARRLVAFNLGDPDLTPKIDLGRLSQVETGRALELLKTMSTAAKVNTPYEFLDDLTVSTAAHVGLDEAKVEKAVRAHAVERKQQEAMEQEAHAAQGGQGGPQRDGASPAEQRAAVGQTVDSAFELVRRVQLGQDPADAVATMAPQRHRGPNPAGNMPANMPVVDLARGGDAEGDKETGGMVALHLRDEDARRLVLDVDGAESLEDLHLTLNYIGPDVSGWDAKRTADVLQAAERVARGFEGPVSGRVWAHAAFNPDGESPCAVYLVGSFESPRLENEQRRDREARRRAGEPEPENPVQPFDRDPVQAAHSMLEGDMVHLLGEWAHEQHKPFIPHVTAGYGIDAGALGYTGPVVFDRLSVHLAGERHDYPLTEKGPDDDA